MKLLVDEGVERYLVESLRAAGHDVAYVAEFASGISDDVVLEFAVRDGCVLLTNDKDFGEIVFKQGKVPGGVLLLRLAGDSRRTRRPGCWRGRLPNMATNWRGHSAC